MSRVLAALIAGVFMSLGATACIFQIDALPVADDGAPLTPDASINSPDGNPPDAPVVIDADIDAPPEPDAPPDIDAPLPSPCFPDFAGQVACYAFEPSTSLSVVVDGSQYGNDGMAQSVSYESGFDGDSILLNVNSRIVVPDDASLDFTTEMTIEAWINPSMLTTSATGANVIVAKQGQYGLYINALGQLTCLTSNGQASGGLIVQGIFTHVACVFSQAGITVYVQGISVGTGQVSGSLHATSNALVIGGSSPCNHAPCSNSFIGLMDDLTLWNYARSNGQICADAHVPGC
jgi:hypothetical protein